MDKMAGKTAVELLDEAKALGLDGVERAAALDPARLCVIYNGTGPEWLPGAFREILDDIAADILPAVLLHDVDYALGDGTAEDYSVANLRLSTNGVACAKARYPWWRWRRYRVMRLARVFGAACELFGWSAYCAACAAKTEEADDGGVE